MGFFSSIGNLISKPIRGVSRILRGKFKKGLADIGSTAQTAAPVLAATGVGAPLSLAIGAGGGALSSLDDGGGISGFLKGAGTGAAQTGAALALRGIGQRLMGAGGGPATPGGGGGPGLHDAYRAATTTGAAASPATVTSVAPAVVDASPSLASRVVDAAKDVGGYLKDNPELLVAGGEYLGGLNEGRALDLEEERLREEQARVRDPDLILRDLLLSGNWRLGGY